MKISIGYKNIHGPWGGGLNFSRLLTKFLEEKNINVTTNLNSNDIDIILLTEPRRYTRSSSFTHKDVNDYLKNINYNSIVINRINECDERKKTKGLNKFLINSSEISDYTVFISSWLESLFISQGFNKNSLTTIKNGADDFIVRHGKEDLQRLIGIAREAFNGKNYVWQPEPQQSHHVALIAKPAIEQNYAYSPVHGLIEWVGTKWESLEEKPKDALSVPLHEWMDLMNWEKRSNL